MIIGKGGETIRQLQQESKAKIQVAKKEIENTGVRNVFVDGPEDRFRHAKSLIDAIIAEYQKTHAPSPGFISVDMTIPNSITGLLIGKNGETLKKLMAKTKAQVIIPKDLDYTMPERTIHIKGTKEQIDAVKKEVESLKNSSLYGGRMPGYMRDGMPYCPPWGMPGMPMPFCI